MNASTHIGMEARPVGLAAWLLAMPRLWRRALTIAYDGFAMAVSLWLAFSIRYGLFYWPRDRRIVVVCLVAVILGLGSLWAVGVYRVIVRHMDTRAPEHLVLGAIAAASAWFILAFVSRLDGLPRSVGFIYPMLLFVLMLFGRVAAANLMSGVSRFRWDRGRRGKDNAIGVAICGANPTGHAVAVSLRLQSKYKLRYFIDNNRAMIGRIMLGVPVRSPRQLHRAARSGEIEQVFLALRSTTRAERLALTHSLLGMSVSVMTVPSYEEMLSGHCTVSDVRPVRVEDLLERDLFPPNEKLVGVGIRRRSVLITGAGGSIGAEICRQVLGLRPTKIVLLDHSEFALYSIDAELREIAAAEQRRKMPPIIPVVGSLLDEELVRRILNQNEIDTVFHAAAYKHVPLLEYNEVIGVRNNVIGTKVLADACVAASVTQLTMISSDKAVRPTNVMGASKRIAELYIQALASDPEAQTRFGIVRFGNVLDSSGSVVQHFRRQIEQGGPITVTDPEVSRFFMSIPEATRLVLQASALASDGEVFVLDMGEPVRIVDLARTMISLSGMSERTDERPDGDIEIAFTGLRPGEKLHEELFVGDDVEETDHPQIKMARERSLSLAELEPTLRDLIHALEIHDAKRVRQLLDEVLEVERGAAPFDAFHPGTMAIA